MIILLHKFTSFNCYCIHSILVGKTHFVLTVLYVYIYFVHVGGHVESGETVSVCKYILYINNISCNILFTICHFHIAHNAPYTWFTPDLFHSHYFQFQKFENILMYSVYLGPVYMEVKDPRWVR